MLVVFDVLGASWKYHAAVAINFKWNVGISYSVYRLRAWPETHRRFQWHWTHYWSVRLVLISNRSKANATNDHCRCTATRLLRMLRKHRMHSWSFQKCELIWTFNQYGNQNQFNVSWFMLPFLFFQILHRAFSYFMVLRQLGD